MKVFFATDIHGSEICWRKFLNAAAFYKADAVILGGDVTGKVMVPITEHNGYWQVVMGGETVRLETREELAEAERQIRNRGSYPAVMPPDELTELSKEEGAVDRRFSKEMISSLDRWLDMADGKLKGGQIPCILNGGNDDIWEIDASSSRRRPSPSARPSRSTSMASTWSRWAGPTRRRGTPSAKLPRTC